MLEAGLGLIAANLIIIYGLLAGLALKGVSRSVRALFSRPSASPRSDTEQGARPSDEKEMWSGGGGEVASYAQFTRKWSPLNDDGSDSHDIRVVQTLERTENRA